MNTLFYKYHGAGNDFIILDNREQLLKLNEQTIHKLCHRQFGIGADGLMLVQNHKEADFEMIYYNADGKIGSMCGNGGRCIADFAYKILEITKKEMSFIAADGSHDAKILKDNFVSISMQNVQDIRFEKDCTILNTGSPHYIIHVNNIASFPVFDEGKRIRNSAEFKVEGINVNFVEEKNETLHIRTYERGVENETLACGTGITAAAIAKTKELTGIFEQVIVSKEGDKLTVCFEKDTPFSARNIILIGPVQCVFKGEIDLENF